MMIYQVVGHGWEAKKEEKLNGHKLMIVREETTTTRKGSTFVAADSVGAGIGEMVLVVSGSTARRAIGEDDAPIDSAIVGIILGVTAVILCIVEFVYILALSNLAKDPANAAIINQFMDQVEQQLRQMQK